MVLSQVHLLKIIGGYSPIGSAIKKQKNDKAHAILELCSEVFKIVAEHSRIKFGKSNKAQFESTLRERNLIK